MPPGAPPAPGAVPPGAVPPGAPPVAESTGSHPKARLIKAIHTAKKHGATLDTTLDFGHKEMTLHDCIHECGMEPKDFGFDSDSDKSGVEQMLKSISGFWNKEARNFTIGGTRAKTKVLKDFKNGEFSNATEQDLHHVLKLIDKMDPSEQHVSSELGHIRHLAGMHDQNTDEDMMDPQDMMKGMMGQMGGMQMPSMPQGGTNSRSSSYTINGKPVSKAEYDQFMVQHPELAKAQQLQNKPHISWDPAVRQQRSGGTRRVAGDDMMESELTAMLKIAGLR
jgi:hypothetical protein